MLTRPSIGDSVLVLMIALGLASIFGSYYVGKAAGSAKAKEAIDRLVKDHRELITKAQEKVQAEEQKFIKATTTHSMELAQVKRDYEKAIANINSAAASGMRKSEARASTYKLMAQTSTVECRNLAEHTARLDRSLEEGRAVAGELRETVKLRDSQLITVGKELLGTRLLIENLSNDNSR